MILEGKYGILKEIGKGEFGEVYMAENLATKQEVAIKQVVKSELERIKKRQELFQTEKKIMEKIQNENVIKLLDHIETKEKHYLVMDYCNQGDLDSYIKSLKAQNKKPLSEEMAKNFLKQLLNGFKGLHELFVIHRDLKLKNILVNDGILKIADFGLSKVGELGVTHVGTPYTKAPEVFKGRGRIRYNNKADIWSLGVIFYQLLFDLKYPFNGQNEQDLFNNIEKSKDLNYAPKGVNVTISEEAKQLLRRMLTRDPIHRITWDELYFDKYLNFEEKEVSSFDPLYQDIMSKFQLIRQIQQKLQETLGNSERLKRDFKLLTNVNQYYIQFMLAKRILMLSRALEIQIQTLKQNQKFVSKALSEYIREIEDNQFVYNIYLDNTKQNLEAFINKRKKQNKEYEQDVVYEMQNKNNMVWGTFMRVAMNYYSVLLEQAEKLEDQQGTMAIEVYDHILDLLKSLESDSAFEGDKLKQKSQSSGEFEEKQREAATYNFSLTNNQFITIKKLCVKELFEIMFSEY